RESRFFQPNLNEGGFAGLQSVLTKKKHVSHHLCGSHMKPNPLFELDGFRSRSKQLEMTIEHRSGRKKSGYRQDHSALDFRNINALQVHRGTLACARLKGGMAMDLNPADPRSPLRWEDFNFLFFPDMPGNERTCNNSPEPFHCETSVHRQSKDIGLV